MPETSTLFVLAGAVTLKDMASSALAKIENRLKSMGEMSDTAKKRFEAFKTTAKVGAAITGMGVVGAKAISGLVSAYSELEQAQQDAASVATLAANSQYRSIGEGMDALREKVLAFSSAHTQSAAEMMAASYNLLSSGMTIEETIASIDKAALLATAGMGDTQEAAAIMGQTLNTFGKRWAGLSNVEKADRVMNTLAGTVKKFQTTLPMLQEGMKYATAEAAAAGLDFEETAAAVGMLQTAGLQGSLAGTAFAGTIRRAAQAGKELGIRTKDSHGKLLPFADILDQIRKRFGPTLEQGEMIKLTEAFGDEGARAVKLLYGQADALRAHQKELKNTAFAEEMARERESSFSAQMQITQNNIRGLAISLGETMVPYLQMANRGLQRAIDWFKRFREAHPNLTKTIGLVLVFGTATALVLGPLLTFVGLLGMAKIGLGAMKLGGVIGGLGKFGGALKRVISVVGAFGKSVLVAMGPVGWVIMGAVAVGALLYLAWKKNFLGIRDIVGRMVESIKWHWDVLKAATLLAWNNLKLTIFKAIGGIASILDPLLSRLPGRLGEEWRNAFAGVQEAIAQTEGNIASLQGEFTKLADQRKVLETKWATEKAAKATRPVTTGVSRPALAMALPGGGSMPLAGLPTPTAPVRPVRPASPEVIAQQRTMNLGTLNVNVYAGPGPIDGHRLGREIREEILRQERRGGDVG